MGLLDMLKGKKKAQTTAPKWNGVLDRVDYHLGDAIKTYCNNQGREKGLSDEEIEANMEEIQYYAGNHIGFFMTWIIKNHFEGEIHKAHSQAVEAVRNEKMLGMEFVLRYCGAAIKGEDFCDAIIPFVRSYYNEYMHDYVNWALNEFDDFAYQIKGTWEDYYSFEAMLDEAYEYYKEKH